MLKQTTIFNVSFHLRAFFQNVMRWCLCVLRTLLLSLSLTWTVVGERRFRPSVAVVDGRRFRPISGHLKFISMSIMLVQQRSEPLVEEWNMLTTNRIIGQRTDSVVGCKQVLSVLMDAAVLACTFPLPSFVVKYNQLYSEMRNVRACCYDVTTRLLCFGTARQLSTDLESPEISCRQENSRSHFFFFVVTAFSVVACVLLHACSFVSHPPRRTAQGGIILLDVVSENIPSSHGLCLSCMVIASAAILLLC